jgi:hypothetical protein
LLFFVSIRRQRGGKSVELFGLLAQRLTEQQNHNDDDEKEADRAAANPNGRTKNRQ